MSREFLFDITRELRHRAVRGRPVSDDPQRSDRIEAALAEGRRVFIDVEDELLYVETPLEPVIRDPDGDRPMGARRL